jgi:hypothetical protein
VRRPARTRHAEHVVVEPRSPLPSLVEADAALLAELLGAVQRFAADIRQRHGACRVQSDVRAGAGARLRFELIAPQS